MNHAEIDRLLEACRVPDSMTDQRMGLWEIRRFYVPQNPSNFPEAVFALRCKEAGLGGYKHYTALLRDTTATMHRDFGDVVMEDTPRELRKHLPILMKAHGRILISGLGLGCVVRGLLAKPEVERIDVVEIDATILDLVSDEFFWNPRVRFHHGDALTMKWPEGMRWDFAWHDIWTEDDSLAVLHMKLMEKYDGLVDRQGAWEFPRSCKRVVQRHRPRMLA
jgi:hypothetical protein